MRLRAPTTPGPYGVEPALHLDFLSPDEVAGQGVSLFPASAPPTVDRGLILNGTTQYASIPLSRYTTAFAGGAPSEVTLYCEFWPAFDYTDATSHRSFFDGSGPIYTISKSATGPNFNITVYAGDYTTVAQIAAAVYGSLWRTNAQNKIVAALRSGSNDVYMNGVSVYTGVTAWLRLPPPLEYIGAFGGGGGFFFFSGKIADFRIYNRKLTASEAVEMSTLS